MEINYLRSIIDYDRDTGILWWKERTPEMFSDGTKSREWQSAAWNAKFAGKPALHSINQSGYLRGNIKKTQLRAHHVAWALVHGEWPSGQIDHINGNRSDNRISNLRKSSQSENMANASRRSRKTNYRGIFPNGRGWGAKVCVNYKQIFGGTFPTEVEAARKYDEMAKKYFGEYAILNFSGQSDRRHASRSPFPCEKSPPGVRA